MTAIELLPCPFCGGKASTRLYYKGRYAVHCDSCDAHMRPCDTEAEAIEAWNKRAILAHLNDIARDYVELPKDADGEYIHVGDDMFYEGKHSEVEYLTLLDSGWVVEADIQPYRMIHYHKPTVEDVLREFIAEFNRDDTELCDGEIIERFADKLREVMRFES